MKLWVTASGQEIRTLKGHSGDVLSVAFSPDGTCLASAGWDYTVRLWEARPLTQAVRTEVEALAFLEALSSKPLPRTEVCAALKKEVILDEASRERALKLADSLREEIDLPCA